MAFPARRLAVGLGVTALALTACGPAINADVSFDTVAPSAQSVATVVADPVGAKKVDPDRKVVVTANDGQLSTVTVMGPKGPMPGSLSSDGTTWTAASSTLEYGATYTVQATAIDARGIATTQSGEFRTKKPKGYFAGSVLPDKNSTVGVGTPITVTFDRAIKNKADVERALVVRTPKPLMGAWAWKNDSTVEFRPKKYWPGNIDITVDMNLKGVQAEKAVFGKENTSSTFSTGPSMVTKVNAQTHKATVIRNGKKIRTIPITTGKAGFETRSGTLLIVSKERTRIMDAATGGTSKNDPEYYRLEVEYAMRITYSGEFLHAAPWSVGSQGFANVSHGCIGMSTSNAAWLYGLSDVGDVVEVTGTGNPQNLGNGITVWTQPWKDWLKDSKAGPVMTVAADPSSAGAGEQPSSGTTDSAAGTDTSSGAVVTQQTAYQP